MKVKLWQFLIPPHYTNSQNLRFSFGFEYVAFQFCKGFTYLSMLNVYDTENNAKLKKIFEMEVQWTRGFT